MESYSVQAVLSAVDKGFSGAFKQAADATQTLEKRAGGSLMAVGKTSTVVGTAIGAMAGKAVKSYGDFQNSINQAAVIGGSSNKKLSSNMKGLEKVALSLGKTLPVSADDAAKAMVEMARNGASVGELKKEFPAIAKAAAVSGADMSDTATTVQQAMNIWGGGAKNAAKYSATLAIVANKSNAEIGDMGQVFANVGTSAKNMGFSLKDVGVAAGLMTNAGIPAAQASMDLNHAFTQMVKPSAKAAAEMDKLGLSYTDQQGNMKPLKKIIQDTAKATEGMSGAQKTAALNTLFGAAGAKAMAPLLDSVGDKAKKSGKGWDSFSSAIDRGAGSAKKANKYLSDNSQNMTKNVGQALDQMVDAFDALIKTSIGSIAPQIQAVANAVGNFATWLNTSKSPLASFTRKMIAITPIIAAVLVVFGLLAMGVGKLVSAFGAPIRALMSFKKGASAAGKASVLSAGQLAGMGAKAAGIGIGIGAAAAGLGVFAVGVAKLAATGTQGVITLAAMTASIVILAGAFALLKGPLTAAIPAMLSLSVTMLSAGAAALMIGGAIALVGVGIDLAGQGVMKLVQAFVLLSQNMTAIVPTMTAVGQGFAMMIVGFVTALASHIPQVSLAMATMMLGILTTINTYMPQLMAQGVKLIVNFINGIAQGLPQIVLAATNLIVNFINAIATSLPRIIIAGAQAITAFLNGIAQNIGRVITAAVSVLVAFVNGIASNLGRVINAGINLLGKFLSGIANAIPRLASVAVKAVLQFVRGVGNALGQVLASGRKLLSTFVRGIISGYGQASSAGKGAGSKGARGASSTRGLFSNAGRALLSALASAISSLGGRVMSAAKSAASRGASGARSAMGAFRSAGSNLVSGLVNGIRSMAGSVMSAASNLASRAAATIKKSLKIHSPSRVTFGFGSYFGEGFVNGISSMQKQVQRVAGGMGDLASNALNSNIQALNANVSGSYNGSLTMQDSSLQMQNNALLRTIAGKNTDLYLDGNTLVGGTANRMDNALGNNTRLRGRFS